MPSPEEASSLTSPPPPSVLTETSSTDPSSVPASFADLGLVDSLCESCSALGFKAPTEIQKQSIPLALQGKDLIGLAQTGSGKTAAFSLPILQAWLKDPKPMFALVLAPTRELAHQIANDIENLGKAQNVKAAVILGGEPMMTQAIALAKGPHFIVATPGRLVDHIESTTGFVKSSAGRPSLQDVKYLVLDEADRLLDMDFGPSITEILKHIPRKRQTFLFSATKTVKVDALKRASLSNPVSVNVVAKYSTPATLRQQYVSSPATEKDVHLVYLASQFPDESTIIFTTKVTEAQRLTFMLKELGFPVVSLHGQMAQPDREVALKSFKKGRKRILIATDLAGRGLDMTTAVDLVINFSLPQTPNDYIHRVGRTARAGRTGRSITVLTEFDIQDLKSIESATGVRMDEFKVDEPTVGLLKERVGEASRISAREMRELEKKNSRGKRKRMDGKGKDEADRDDDVKQAGIPTRVSGVGKKTKR
ncbi:atp-dependent rrna helicase rrp3 [Phaffia rhodozyma]|uniref:Atp-dependent rrna helicase rrp3 n=1 Tax=Phaffia rhodozyma TaxID=264483 RepID=A0A0F7SWE2_PHARH|nr:atp-dependent rrna helicase rrp3 [Phaffia rhodozyma]